MATKELGTIAREAWENAWKGKTTAEEAWQTAAEAVVAEYKERFCQYCGERHPEGDFCRCYDDD